MKHLFRFLLGFNFLILTIIFLFYWPNKLESLNNPVYHPDTELAILGTGIFFGLGFIAAGILIDESSRIR